MQLIDQISLGFVQIYLKAALPCSDLFTASCTCIHVHPFIETDQIIVVILLHIITKLLDIHLIFIVIALAIYDSKLAYIVLCSVIFFCKLLPSTDF